MEKDLASWQKTFARIILNHPIQTHLARVTLSFYLLILFLIFASSFLRSLDISESTERIIFSVYYFFCFALLWFEIRLTCGWIKKLPEKQIQRAKLFLKGHSEWKDALSFEIDLARETDSGIRLMKKLDEIKA